MDDRSPHTRPYADGAYTFVHRPRRSLDDRRADENVSHVVVVRTVDRDLAFFVDSQAAAQEAVERMRFWMRRPSGRADEVPDALAAARRQHRTE
jgi:hypothetical protein